MNGTFLVQIRNKSKTSGILFKFLHHYANLNEFQGPKFTI